MINYAIMFPGQGSQSIGMLNDLDSRSPLIKQTFDETSERVGYDVWKLIQEGPKEKLNQTAYTQVAMLAADVAIFRLLERLMEIKPLCMAGHSLGEYAALVCADAIDLADAAELVATRGQYMQEYVPLGQGAMAAVVGLANEEVTSICEKITRSNHQVEPANYNAIGQVVIAGHTKAVQEAISLCEKEGARMAKIIPVSVPCHCSLLKEASDAFSKPLLETNFRIPKWPVISNVDLSIYKLPEQITHNLKRQLYSPVRWVETIQKMKTLGVERVIECGPGKVLSGLIKRIETTLIAFPSNDNVSFEKILGSTTNVTTVTQ